jgi:hypothetical protein
MAEQDAELFQVGVGKLGQDLGVDRIFLECFDVALQPQLAQPSRNVPRRSPPCNVPRV